MLICSQVDQVISKNPFFGMIDLLENSCWRGRWEKMQNSWGANGHLKEQQWHDRRVTDSLQDRSVGETWDKYSILVLSQLWVDRSIGWQEFHFCLTATNSWPTKGWRAWLGWAWTEHGIHWRFAWEGFSRQCRARFLTSGWFELLKFRYEN